jgi:two-component system sensor histidine kinase RpfC
MDLRLTKPIEAKLLLSTIEQQTASNTPPVTATNGSDPFGVIQSIDAPSEPNLNAPIDPAQLDYLLSIGDEMFVQSIIDTYLEDSQQILQDFNDAVETDNIEDFRFHAHAFKSGANNIGATSLSEMCGKLEVIVETDFENNRSNYLSQVNKEICRITDYLNARSEQEHSEKLPDIGQTG